MAELNYSQLLSQLNQKSEYGSQQNDTEQSVEVPKKDIFDSVFSSENSNIINNIETENNEDTNIVKNQILEQQPIREESVLSITNPINIKNDIKPQNETYFTSIDLRKDLISIDNNYFIVRLPVANMIKLRFISCLISQTVRHPYLFVNINNLPLFKMDNNNLFEKLLLKDNNTKLDFYNGELKQYASVSDPLLKIQFKDYELNDYNFYEMNIKRITKVNNKYLKIQFATKTELQVNDKLLITIYYADHVSLYQKSVIKVSGDDAVIIPDLPEPINKTIKIETSFVCSLTFEVESN